MVERFSYYFTEIYSQVKALYIYYSSFFLEYAKREELRTTCLIRLARVLSWALPPAGN